MKKINTILAAAFLMTAALASYGETVGLNVSLSHPYLMAKETQTAYLKIALTGVSIEGTIERTPANVAIVLDKSGSMDGDKLYRAKEAARMAIDMLDTRDIVSIVTYSDTVHTLVPATRLSDRGHIKRKIDKIYSSGSTALFAGVSKGAEEIRKFLDKNRVNRVILLSDGLANVGPDSPGALGDLGSSLKREGISVTTIGLGSGYNEDLMSQLAAKSDGNHAFVENSKDLVRIFQYEFKDILSVVAQNLDIEIRCSPGIIPKRGVGREVEIIGNKVYTSLNQLYGGQEKYFLIEVEVIPQANLQEMDIASVNVNYSDTQTKSSNKVYGSASVKLTDSQEKVELNLDKDTMVATVMQIATEQSEEAVRLRDMGKIEEARQLLENNASFLAENAAGLGSEVLEDYSVTNSMDAEVIDEESEWNVRRKAMRDTQFENKTQQSY